VQKFLTEKNIPVTTQPPDLTQSNFFSVPYSKNGLQRDKFYSHGGHQIECGSQTPEDSKRSRRCFQQLHD
jgi:hypothetical protein